MKKYIAVLIFSVCLISGLQAQQKPDFVNMPSEEFLRLAQRAPAQETWMKMRGTIQHRRTGSSTLTAKIRLGVRFMPARAMGVLSLNEGAESYRLSQNFTNPPTAPTCIAAGLGQDPEKAQLPLFGLSPNDLMLGFLYQKPLCEEANQRVSIYNTRVFVMFLPKGSDSGKDFDQYARVYISTDYVFPLKVEWFKENPIANKKAVAYRAFEIVAIKEINGFVMISKLRLDGPDWRTRIDFEHLDAGNVKDSLPGDLFNLKGSEETDDK